MLELIITIILIYLIYYFWIVLNFDKTGNLKRRTKKENKNLKIPSEAQYFIMKYNVDLKKINYRYFLQVIGLLVAFDIAIVANIVVRIDELWIQLIVGFILTILVSIISFALLGRYFKKKGLTKNVDNKRNRK